MWWLHQDSLPLTVRVCDSTASLRHSFALTRDKSGAVGVNTTHSRLVAVSISFLQDVHCNYFLFYVRIPCVWSKVNKTIRLNKIILVATSKPPDFFFNVISCLNWLIYAYLRSIFAGLQPKSAQRIISEAPRLGDLCSWADGFEARRYGSTLGFSSANMDKPWIKYGQNMDKTGWTWGFLAQEWHSIP